MRPLAPSDKRFRRSHVKPSARRGSRWRRAWAAVRALALAALAAYGAWTGVSVIAGTPLLHVTDIVVEGHHRLSKGEVLTLVEGLRGQHILQVRLDDWQARLRSSPWVESASLRRILPATIEVAVRERTPIAIGRLGTGLYLIDEHGVVLDEYGPAYVDIDLPIVDGLGVRRGQEITVDEARARLAGRVVASIAARPDIEKRVSLIDVSDPDDAVVMLEGDTALLRLGAEAFVERLQQYLDLGDALRERVAVIDYVDLRFGERLYVRPARGSATAPASAPPRR
jgi:cell division protein FtsQ